MGSSLRRWSPRGGLLAAVTSCSGWELNWAQMGVRASTGETAMEFRGGAVFSLSLTGDDCRLSFDLDLPNMEARLVEDFMRLVLSAWGSWPRGRRRSSSGSSLDLSLSLARVRSETELTVFVCRLFLGPGRTS